MSQRAGVQCTLVATTSGTQAAEQRGFSITSTTILLPYYYYYHYYYSVNEVKWLSSLLQLK
jgi:hypothetical protein